MQDKKQLNLFETLGVAVREMDTSTGPADYMLFIDGKACGIIEAKREGAELGHVDAQSKRYAGKAVVGRNVNGWTFWYIKDANGDWVRLNEIAV